MKKKTGKSRTTNTIRDLMRASRSKIDRIVRAAAQWWLTSHGRRIKAGAVKEAIRAWKRGRFTPPAWLSEYATRGDTSLLFA